MRKSLQAGLLRFLVSGGIELANNMIFETEKERWTLPNGVRVIAESLPFISSVSVGVWIHTGSMMEDTHEEGLSHFMEHSTAPHGYPRCALQRKPIFSAVSSMHAQPRITPVITTR